MKKLLFITFLFLAPAAYGQCIGTATDPCVPVNQSYIDDSTKAFKLLEAKEAAIQALLKERPTSAVAYDALKLVSDAKTVIIQMQDQKDALAVRMFAIYEQVIKMQSDLLDKMEKRLNKPKSAWQKFAAVLKDIANISLGVAIGRGAGF